MALPLIDKIDNSERIRDKIAALLLAESEHQQTLAADAGQDPERYRLRVFVEASNPWEQMLNDPEDNAPIVNVWLDNLNFDESASNVMERQKARGLFNVDCFGSAVSRDLPEGGHEPGDQQAALECQRAVRLCRNILMSDVNTYLDLRGLVAKRMPQSITYYQPNFDGRFVQNVVGGRLALMVDFNEFSPQTAAEVLEYLAVDVNRAETGELYFSAAYDYQS